MTRRHVAIRFNPAWRPYLKRVAQGFARYVHERTHWRVTPLVLFGQQVSETRYQPLQPMVFDGIVTGISPEFRQRLLENPLPKVVVGPEGMNLGVPWVGPDYEAVGRAGAADLIARGARSLVVFRNADPTRQDINLIASGAYRVAKEQQTPCRVFTRGSRTRARGQWYYSDQQADLIDLLKSVSPPIGILCSDDEHAWRALECCHLAELRVPDMVTVLGIGDDEFICQLATPTISSIRIDHEAVGYLAAQTLDNIFHGRPVPLQQTAGLSEVVSRQSTRYVATDDPHVARAIRFISDNLEKPLTNENIADAAHTGARTLQRRFLAQLNRTPTDEVRRQRVERAIQMIRSTDLSLAYIAQTCGFSQQSAMGRAVKSMTGRTPGRLRRES